MAGRGDINRDEIQPRLFEGWEKIRIEETLEKPGVFTKLKSKDYFDEGKFPVVDQGDKFISGFVNDENLLYQGELPIIIFGDHTRNVKYIDFPFATGADGTKILKPKAFYNSKFFHYYFKSLKIPNLGYSRHFSILKEIEFPLPPLAEQNRIVAKLDTLFAQVETINTNMANIPLLLKDFRQQVLTQAVNGKLTEEWRKAKKLTKWQKLKIGDIIKSIEAGKSFLCLETPASYGQVGLIKISAVTWNFFNAKETKTVTDLQKINPNYFIKSGDFLISRANTLELVGSSVIVDKIDLDIMLSDKVWRVNFKNDNDKFFINFFLKTRIGRSEIETRATGNQLSMRNLSQNNFKDIDVNMPSATEQLEIVSRVESLFDKATAIEKQYKSLKQKTDNLTHALLYKAFKGELTDQLETDGDVKELLNEIWSLKNYNIKSKN